MSFNSLNYLFLFLPVSITLYLLTDHRYKNYVALAASLIFFSWNNPISLPLMAALIGFNFYLGKKIENKRDSTPVGRRLLILGIFINVSLLLFFKVYSPYTGAFEFFPARLTALINKFSIPLGLSYITFQVVSYLFDVYNERCDSEKSLINFSLYVLLFPKILVGPITRYRDLAESLRNRDIKADGVYQGLRRFIIGLAKKVLIADTIAVAINPSFSLETPNFRTSIAWFMLIGYAIQLYFDFSGVTDMAIGIGQVLGFRFMENFNYPYISRSITEFWRRWHISLSSWFRDYVFYPLEFQRRNSTFFRQQIDIFVVFLLTGLWHGPTINFLIWGGLHGLALALEMTFMDKIKKLWTPIQHLYTLVVILAGWVFFRSPTPQYAIQFFARLAGSQDGIEQLPYGLTAPLPIINNTVWIALILGIIFSVPILPLIKKRWSLFFEQHIHIQLAGQILEDILLFTICIFSIAAVTYTGVTASIYGGF